MLSESESEWESLSRLVLLSESELEWESLSRLESLSDSELESVLVLAWELQMELEWE